MKLTEHRIESLVVEAGHRDRMVFDSTQRGLAVRVTANGSRSYSAQYTLNGKKHRVPLGNCEALSLAKAREAAAGIIGDVAKGKNPAQERKDAVAQAERERNRVTLDQLIDNWQREHLSMKRPGYAKEAVRAIRHAFGSHLLRPADELDREKIKRILTGKPPAAVSHTIIYGHALYSWAMKEDIVEANPFANLSKPSPTKRKRVLSDEELAAVWNATQMATDPFGKIVPLLALTGQRRAEVAAMAWRELAPDLMAWTIPGVRTKNHETQIVPLSAPVRDIINTMPRTGPLVFPAEGQDKKAAEESVAAAATVGPSQRSFAGWSKAKARLDAASGVTDWWLHDLRRTLATGLQRLGVRLEVTEAVLNHISGSRGGIVGIYQRHDWANEKRAALDAWAAHIIRLADPNHIAAENVVRPAFGPQLAA